MSIKSYKPLTRNQVIARVSNWECYCLVRGFDSCSNGDGPGSSVWYAEAQRARHDLAYLKRGTNWREFEHGTYAYGSRTPWTFMYPAEISTPLPWDLIRRMAATAEVVA